MHAAANILICGMCRSTYVLAGVLWVGSGWFGLVLVIIACRCYLHCGPFEWKVLACLLMNIKVMTLKHTHIGG